MRTIATNIIILIFPLLLFCQDENFVVKTYTTENGLVNNNVRSIVQDEFGFLWIATWNGLSRFDGIEFKNYYHDPDDSTSLPYFEIFEMEIDNEENLWVISQFLSKYDRVNDNFITYDVKCDNASDYQELRYVNVIDPENIWFLCNDGRISKFNSRSNNVTEYNQSALLFGTGRFKVKNDRLFIFNLQSIQEYMINEKRDSILFLADYELPESTEPWGYVGGNFKFYCDIINGKNNEYYAKFPLINFRIGKESGKIHLFIPDETIWPVMQNNHESWFSTENGIWYKPKTNPKAVFVTNSVTGFPQAGCIDNSDILWVGGHSKMQQGYGLKAIIPVPSFFKHQLWNYENEEKMAVFACYKDHLDQLWVGIKNLNFLYKIDNDGKVEECNFISDEEKWNSKQPRAFLELGDSLLLIGYYREIFRKYTYSTNSFSSVPEIDFKNGSKILPFCTKLLAKYDENTIIVGADTIILKFNLKTNCIENYFSSINFTCMSLRIDSDLTIWVGYHLGFLYHFDCNLKLLEKFRLCNSNLESICETEDGIFWIASLGEGLFRFDKKTKKWHSFNTRDGLVNNVLYNVLKDRKGNLWMSSDHGISMFNPREEIFRNYGLSDGLLIDEFNADAACLAPDGEMIFGGVGGIVRFYPDSIIENSALNPPKLLISDLQVSGKSRHFAKALYELDKLDLDKGENNVKLFFTCTDLKNADKIRYRYQMEKVDNDWIVTDHRNRSVNYSGLAPGYYQFLLEATNPFGDWEYKTSLIMHIPAYYYQTWWFRSILALLLSGMILLFVMLRLKQIQIKNRQMQQNLRLESLRGQLNPHFIYNSLNSINYFIAKTDRENANQYIADFARLMRAILNNSSADFIPLKREMEAVSDYLQLEHMRFSDKFDYELEINPDLEIENIEVAPTMLQPFIENSIWHGVRYLEGRKGKIVVRFGDIHENFLLCSVEDDGIGRKLSSERKSIDQKKRRSRGIKIIMERIAILNSINKTNCRVIIENLFDDKEECGTKVTVELPTKILS